MAAEAVVYRLKNTRTGKYASGHSMYSEDSEVGATYQTVAQAKTARRWREGRYKVIKCRLVEEEVVKE